MLDRILTPRLKLVDPALHLVDGGDATEVAELASTGMRLVEFDDFDLLRELVELAVDAVGARIFRGAERATQVDVLPRARLADGQSRLALDCKGMS